MRKSFVKAGIHQLRDTRSWDVGISCLQELSEKASCSTTGNFVACKMLAE